MRRLLAGAVAVVAAAVVVPDPAAGQDDEPGLADHLTVVAQTPWVEPGLAFNLRLRVDDAPDDAELRVSVRNRVRTRSEFARAVEGNGLRSELGEVRTTLADATNADSGVTQVRVATGGDQPAASLTQAGVYPVVVELSDDGEVVDRLVTMLVRLPLPDPDEVPIGAAVVVPLHAPPAHVAPGEIDADALARLDATVDVLLDHPDVAATLVPTPESIAAAVDADPRSAERFAEVAAGRQVLAGPWVRLDPGAWVRAGLADELARQLEVGAETVADVLGEVPDATTWVAPDGVGRAAAAAMRVHGASTIVAPSGELAPLDEGDFPLTLTRPFRLQVGAGEDAPTAVAVAADDALAAHAGATGDSVLDAHRLLADLAVLALDAPVFERGAVVVLDDRAAGDQAFLDALLGGLGRAVGTTAAPLVEPVTVEDLIETVEPAGADGGTASGTDDDPLVRTYAEDDGPRGLGSLPEDLAEARAATRSYRSVFGDDDGLASAVDELVLTAGAAALDGGERTVLLGTGLGAMQAELGRIHAPPRQRVTLTAREGQIQLAIGNDTERTANVVLELRGDRLEFPDHPDGRVPLQLEEQTTRVDLDVEARTSGDAPLDLRLVTPDGRIELGRSRLTVRTTAVSGVGLVLMGAAALFLVVWWTRTIVRERRSTKRRHPAHAR